jgi:hypothetical protein
MGYILLDPKLDSKVLGICELLLDQNLNRIVFLNSLDLLENFLQSCSDLNTIQQTVIT